MKTNLAPMFLEWYENGKGGLVRLCETEGCPEEVKKAAEEWFDKGMLRAEFFANQIQEMENCLKLYQSKSSEK